MYFASIEIMLGLGRSWTRPIFDCQLGNAKLSYFLAGSRITGGSSSLLSGLGGPGAVSGGSSSLLSGLGGPGAVSGGALGGPFNGRRK